MLLAELDCADDIDGADDNLTQSSIPASSASPAAPIFESALIGVALSVLAVSSVVGNLFVVLAVLIVRKLKKPANLLIVNLAISDIAVALFVMPPAAIREILGFWAFGETMCTIYIVCDVTLCSASILNLCAISIDRYLSITSPFAYGAKRGERSICALIATVWLFALLISVPPLFLWNTKQEPNSCEYSKNLGYQIYAMVASFYAPSIVILVLYARIFMLIRRIKFADKKVNPGLRQLCSLTAAVLVVSHPTYVNGNGNNSNKTAATVETVAVQNGRESKVRISSDATQPHSTLAPVANRVRSLESLRLVASAPASRCGKSEDSMHSRQESNLHSPSAANSAAQSPSANSMKKGDSKAIITLGLILGAFFLSWTPFFVLQLIKTVCSEQCSVPMQVDSVFLWLGYTNSFVNPPIYSIFNRDFRTPFLEFLKCRCATINDKVRMKECYEQFGIQAVATNKLAQVPPRLRSSTTSLRHRQRQLHVTTRTQSHTQNLAMAAQSQANLDFRTNHKITPTAV